jgi:hypothetical protein
MTHAAVKLLVRSGLGEGGKLQLFGPHAESSFRGLFNDSARELDSLASYRQTVVEKIDSPPGGAPSHFKDAESVTPGIDGSASHDLRNSYAILRDSSAASALLSSHAYHAQGVRGGSR